MSPILIYMGKYVCFERVVQYFDKPISLYESSEDKMGETWAKEDKLGADVPELYNNSPETRVFPPK